jgi:transposase
MLTNQTPDEFPGREGRGCHFSKPLILKIVQQVENGLSRSVIVEQYKISRSTIADWMRDYGSATYHAGRQGHLGQANKTSILRAVLDGRMTVREAMIAYRVGSSTIHQWIRAYKREKGELASVMGTKKSSEDKQRKGAADQEKEDLMKALQQAQLQIQALNTLIDVAEDKFKIAIRKKAGAKQSRE